MGEGMERDSFENELQWLAYRHWASVYVNRVIENFDDFPKTMAHHARLAEQGAPDLDALIPRALLNSLLQAENDPKTAVRYGYAYLQAAFETLECLIRDCDVQEFRPPAPAP